MIPRGSYGAGAMIVWDRGTYEVVDGSVESGKLGVVLRGQKLQGAWTLVRTSKDWLFIKKQDAFADEARDPLSDSTSVISGLTIGDLDSGRRPGDAIPGAKAATFPGPIAPMLLGPADKAFSHPDWLFEPKLDGYRVCAAIKDGAVRLQSRGGLDATKDYPQIAEELVAQSALAIVLDGEVVAPDENGRPSFDLLKQRLEQIKRDRRRAAAYPLVYYVFDVLYLDGQDLRCVPLAQRKAILQRTLRQTQSVRLVEHVDEQGEAFFQAALTLGLEGMIAKHKRSIYEPGRRTTQWLKVKGELSDEFVIGGFSRGNGHRADTLGALLLGQHDEAGNLVYAGRAGTGWDDRGGAELRKRLEPLVTDECPFVGGSDPVPSPTWVKPELIAEVKFTEWTRDKRLRGPVFVRLRDDKAAVVVTRAEPIERPGMVKAVLDQLDTRDKGMTLDVGGVSLPLTNLDKALWPGFTKRDLLRYLARVSPAALAQLHDRPVTLIRFPEGIDGERFYQKHWELGRPEFVETVTLYSEHSDADNEFLLCNNLATLLWLGQVGALEFHSYYARITPDPDSPGTTQFAGGLENVRTSLMNYPDFVVFDLDPVRPNQTDAPKFERGRFARVCEAALWLRELLESLGMRSFVKTSGRSGLHVYVPIARKLDYDATRSVSVTLAQFLKKAHPGEIALDWNVAKRVGEVFVDTMQNVRKKTLASVYSPRATPEGTVCTPIGWDEVASIDPLALTLETVPDRLAEKGDLWGPILEAKNDLSALLGV